MTSPPWILGVSYSHNGAACLLRGDAIVVAVQEERLSGEKRAAIRHFRQSLAVRYCLEHAGISIADLDVLAVCHFSSPSAPPMTLADEHDVPLPKRYVTLPHHLGHAHAVFATSGFDDAAVLIVDGQGGPIAHLPPEERTTIQHGRVPGQVRENEVISIYRATRSAMTLLEKHGGELMPGWTALQSKRSGLRSMPRFGSLGGMYSAAADLIFSAPLEAGKVMGLAAHGTPMFAASELVRRDDDGCLHYSDTVPPQFRELDPWPANAERFADLAASIQVALEEAIVPLAARARRLAGIDRLCYAGGVALNSIANERVVALGGGDVFVMPAAEDSGAAIGAAYFGLASLAGQLASRRLVHDSVGRSYSSTEISDAIARVPHVEVVPTPDLLDTIVDRLCDGEILGWFQGGSELGPRALGQRSILCDPRRADAKQRLNDRVKHREAFRPFAPVILLDAVDEWFETSRRDSPYMLRVMRFRPGCMERVPAAAHVDGTGRVQTITREANAHLYALVERFARRTGVPILVNTSFNVAGEPIVETPEDALWCLLATELDGVVLEDRLVQKSAAHDSLLSLVPRLVASRVQLAFPIVDGALRWKAEPDAEASIATTTPWGEHSLSIRASDTRLLGLCDGTRTGLQILDELGGVSESFLARRLGFYRRAHVLVLERR